MEENGLTASRLQDKPDGARAQKVAQTVPRPMPPPLPVAAAAMRQPGTTIPAAQTRDHARQIVPTRSRGSRGLRLPFSFVARLWCDDRGVTDETCGSDFGSRHGDLPRRVPAARHSQDRPSRARGSQALGCSGPRFAAPTALHSANAGGAAAEPTAKPRGHRQHPAATRGTGPRARRHPSQAPAHPRRPARAKRSARPTPSRDG